MHNPSTNFMREAIRAARKAQEAGDYAIGAVVVKGDKVISAAGNRIIQDQSPIGHAETLAIIEASKILKSRHLTDCILYTTHEPCPMCATLCVWAKLKGIVYGARIDDMDQHRQGNGNNKFLWRTVQIPCEEVIARSPETIEVVKEFMRAECVALFHS
jgi:tRNA(Arg) A34 adenosine deaminase TadA